MQNFEEYELWLDAYTPKTIPMDRLAEYLAALAKLLGHQANVHFDRLETGSTVPVVRVEKEAAPKVAARLVQARNGAANDAVAAFNDINRLLKSDNAIGELRHRDGNRPKAVVIQFPGRNMPSPERFGPFWEISTVDGELVRIGGRDSSAHAQIVDPEGVTWSMEMSREMAQRIAPYIYKGPILRVEGQARWERTEKGEWKLLGFKLEDFSLLESDDLSSATVRLRSLKDSAWCDIPNIDEVIKRERGHEDGLH